MNDVVSAVTVKPVSISNRLLLSLYAIMPLCLCFVVLDALAFNYQFRDIWLPDNPGALIWWAIIFNFPHIVSSMVTLLDDEYLPHYRQRFTKALVIITVAVLSVNYLLPQVLSPGLYGIVFILFFIFFAAYTMYHVLSQQFGLGMMMMGLRPDRGFEFWRYSSTFAATLLYLMAFTKHNLQAVIFDSGLSLYDFTQWLALAAVVCAALFGTHLMRRGQQRLGIVYVAANILMLFIVWCMAALEYSFLVILIPRFIHDITAFIIYSVHDHNRNATQTHNYIYRALSFIPLTPLLLCPILAIVLANSIECGAYFLDFGLGFNPANNTDCFASHFYRPEVEQPLPDQMRVGLQILFISGLFHYYIEGFVWKRESLHRHSVSFS